MLIDPPYELKEDYDLVVKAIEEGYKRFATGTYAIWYPVVLRQQTKRIFKGLEATGIRKILKIELAVRPDSDQRGMTASGMVVINPPWQLEQQMKAILPYFDSNTRPGRYGKLDSGMDYTGIIHSKTSVKMTALLNFNFIGIQH